MTRVKKPPAADDLAAWRLLYRAEIDEQWFALRTKPLKEQQAWMKRYLPQHILDALPHLPSELRASFLSQEVYRRLHDMRHLALAHPAAVMRASAGRMKSGDDTAAKRSSKARVLDAFASLPASTKPHERVGRIARKLKLDPSTVRRHLKD